MKYAAHSNNANCELQINANEIAEEKKNMEMKYIPRLSELKHNYRCAAVFAYLPFSVLDARLSPLASGGANELKSRENRIRL